MEVVGDVEVEMGHRRAMNAGDAWCRTVPHKWLKLSDHPRLRPNLLHHLLQASVEVFQLAKYIYNFLVILVELAVVYAAQHCVPALSSTMKP
jgi:hypothetical protein